eukprot:CAMPEP_0202822614 /NCGR_PEP_ID=MMETSP1389-20130828/11197_1 /ASSEMBLY_ACC=CAM_ASM_000865 /TAXON_ID=302021 /ORGANISM="Rhodomonas sp., Strain CCMP768" /LENGTH=236 /DNA_ID=CAMNT_0049495549 /DNA_START=12 /DNA_END=723 /DNA_ORIENTATION=-
MNTGNTRDTADDVDSCGMAASNDLPWPLNTKLLPEEADTRQHVREISSSDNIPAKSKLCQARFNYRDNVKVLQWQGPRGGNALIEIVRQAYGVEDYKLIYLTDGRSPDVLDVDAPLSEGVEYQVRVEPEDGGVLNLMPCIVNMCTFGYATGGKGDRNFGDIRGESFDNQTPTVAWSNAASAEVVDTRCWLLSVEEGALAAPVLVFVMSFANCALWRGRLERVCRKRIRGGTSETTQ